MTKRLDGEPTESGVAADLRRQIFKIAKNPDEINCFLTRGLFLRYSDLLGIGNFHPFIFPHYGSDYEYTIRAHKKGFRLITTPSVGIIADKEQTSIHNVSADNLIEFVRMFFSKKAVSNPLYKSVFILLTAPKIHVPFLILSTWVNVVRVIGKQLFNHD